MNKICILMVMKTKIYLAEVKYDVIYIKYICSCIYKNQSLKPIPDAEPWEQDISEREDFCIISPVSIAHF